MLTCQTVIYNSSQNDHLFFYMHRVVPSATPPPPPSTEGNGNSEARGGPKEGSFRRGGGLLTEFLFFPGGLNKIVELFINNSFSVKPDISYFEVTVVSKQVLLFTLIIFRLMYKLPVI